MAYSRTFYGTGYYIYHQFVKGTALSRPIAAWNEDAARQGRARPDRARRQRHRARGTERIVRHARHRRDHRMERPRPATIRRLEFSVPREQALAFSSARLRITWDDRATPSIDAPVALFFGAGTLYNRDNREYLVKSFPMTVKYERDRVRLSCYFPMPFFRSARIELTGNSADAVWSGASAPMPLQGPARNQVGYFHATYRDHPSPEPGKDLVLLDTRQAEGGGDWCGQLRRHVVHLLPRRRAQHARRRSALLLRRQPDAAGPGHRHRGVGRRRRLLGRPEHDAALRRPSRRRARAPRTPSARRTKSSRPTASCSPT